MHQHPAASLPHELHAPQPLPPRIRAALWRATELPCANHPVVSSGHPALDVVLPGGGWPHQSLTEILSPQAGVLEWRLLGPTWRQLPAQKKPLVLIAPPHSPHLPGLQHEGITAQQLIWVQAKSMAERLWATEQVIKSNDFAAVMVWLPQARPEQMRRLQLCAQAADGLVFAWRPAVAQCSPSAAPLRALVTAGSDWSLKVHVFKRQGPLHEEPVQLHCVPMQLASLMTPRLAHPSQVCSSFLQESNHVVDRFMLDAPRFNRRLAAAH